MQVEVANPDGDELSFTWSQVKKNPNDPDVNLVPVNPKSGIVKFDAPPVSKTTELQFSLNVNDNHGEEAITHVSVTVKPPNRFPEPVIVVTPQGKVESGTTVTLDASRSAES